MYVYMYPHVTSINDVLIIDIFRLSVYLRGWGLGKSVIYLKTYTLTYLHPLLILKFLKIHICINKHIHTFKYALELP